MVLNLNSIEVKHATNNKSELSLLIRNEIQEIFGKQIRSSRDCIQLSEEIFSRTSCRINSNTLRRLFGLVRTSYLPSFSTLNILAQYCGCEDLQELQNKMVPNEEDCNDSNKELLHYMASLFKHIPAKEYNDETFLAVVKRTILFLQRHPQLTERFQKAIAKTRNGQEFYFEQFVHVDALNSYFGKGLHLYLNEKKTTEAQIFGHSLLCAKAYLSNDTDAVKKHYDEMMRHHLNKSIHPFVCGRYFATQIFHAELYGLNMEPNLILAQQVHSAIKPGKENYRGFPGFEYAFSFALLLTGNNEEALYYINYGFKNYRNRHSYVDDGFYQTLELIRANALLNTGEFSEAKKIYMRLQPSGFYFLTKKVDTMLYLKLKRGLKGWSDADERQFEQLVLETGFVRIRKLL